MLEAPHVLIGVAIATKIPHPVLAIPLAFGSHFVLDMLPHWNPHLNTEMKKYGSITKQTKLIIYADAIISLGALAYFSQAALPDMGYAITIAASGIAAITPDLVEAPYFFLKKKNGLLEKWLRFQKSIQTDTGPVLGVLTQVVTVIASLWWILN